MSRPIDNSRQLPDGSRSKPEGSRLLVELPTPASRWRCNEGSGATIADSAGSNGLTIATPNWISSELYVSVADGVPRKNSGVSGLGGVGKAQCTVSGWYKIYAAMPNYWSLFFMGNQSSVPLVEVPIDLGKLRMIVDFTGGLGAAVWGSSETLPAGDGIWHHIAAVYDNGNCYLYLDGASLTVNVIVAGETGIVEAATTNLKVGASDDGAGNPTRFVTGYVRRVKFYNDALTPAQILLDMAAA